MDGLSTIDVVVDDDVRRRAMTVAEQAARLDEVIEVLEREPRWRRARRIVRRRRRGS